MNIKDIKNKGKIAPDPQDQNSDAGTTGQTTCKLYSLVCEIEKLEEQKNNITHTIKAVYEEAAGMSFNKKVLKQVIQDRQQNQQELELFENLRTKYRNIVREAEMTQILGEILN